MGWFAPILAAGASGAMSGLSSKLGMSKEKKIKPEMSPEDKAMKQASMAMIPTYLQTLSGGMPDYLRRYLMQTQSTLAQQGRQGISEYLRQIGGAGMDFGPQQADALRRLYENQQTALMSGLTQSRNQILGNTMQGLQQWSMKQPEWIKQPDKQPSFGAAAGAGAIGSLGGLLGGLKTGGAPKTQSSGMMASNPKLQQTVGQPYTGNLNKSDPYAWARFGSQY